MSLIPSKAQRRLFSQAADALVRVTRRRMKHGPRRPSWSFRYETFIQFLRIQFGGGGGGGMGNLARMRRAFDAGGAQEDKRNRSRTEWTEINGMRAAWVTPLHFAPEDGVVLYLHGGGYVVGSPESHRGIMASIATHASVKVLGIDYRLAPEHACPAAIDDAMGAYRWLLERFSAEQIVIAGDSAGGGLTATTLLAIREQNLPMPAGAVLLSPWVDLHPATAPDDGHDYIAIGNDNAWAEAYAGALSFDDARVSPLVADLSGLPPLLVIAGEVEALAQQCVDFADRARAAGVDVHLHVEPDEVHVYPAFFELSPRAQVGLGRIAHFIRWAYGRAQA